MPPPKSYHVEQSARTFHIYVSVPGGPNFHAQEKEIACGVLNDPSCFEEVIRMVAHANVSLALAAVVESVSSIENAAKSGPNLLH